MGEDPIRRTVVRGTGTGTGKELGTAAHGTGEATTVVARPWWLLLVVRVGRVYGQSLLGFIAAQGLDAIDITAAVETTFGGQWNTLAACAYAALLPSLVTLIHNGVEYITNLDSKWATFHG